MFELMLIWNHYFKPSIKIIINTDISTSHFLGQEGTFDYSLLIPLKWNRNILIVVQLSIILINKNINQDMILFI